MGISKKAFVSCERVDEKTKTEAVGPLADVLSLTVQLLVNISTGAAETGVTGTSDPAEILMAVCATALETLEDMGGSK